MELVKIKQGSKFLYQVVDGNGQVLASRISSRHYVAATANGKFFFRRESLIGRCEHAKVLRDLQECMDFGPAQWEKKRREYLRLYNEKVADKYYNPANMEADIEAEHQYARNNWDGYSRIAYLSE